MSPDAVAPSTGDPVVDAVLAPGKACARLTAKCKRTSARIRVQSSATLTLSLQVVASRPSGAQAVRRNITVKAGKSTLRIPTRGLKRGRYRVVLRRADGHVVSRVPFRVV
jgi:hypothetical protein